MLNTLIGLVMRHVLSGVGGYLTAEGLATGDQVNAVVGGATALAAVVWSAWQKFKAKK